MPADDASYSVGPNFRDHGEHLAIDLHPGRGQGGGGGSGGGDAGEPRRFQFAYEIDVEEDWGEANMDVEEDQSDSGMDVEEYWGKADHFRDDEGPPAVGGQPTLPVHVVGKVMRP